MRLLFFISFLIICSKTASQNLSLIKSVPFENVQNVSVDINGSIYVADDKGNLNQFDSTGRLVNHFSPPQPATVTLLDASRTMNVFIFYRDLQKYTVLNRFLYSSDFTSVNNEYIGYAYLISPSLDNNLWVFDNQSFSLKKYDILLQKVTIDVPLDLVLDSDNYNISYMKEYQNRIYLNDTKKGVLIFDNLGNYLATLPFLTNHFSFTGEEIYFLSDNQIKFYNVYSGKERNLGIKDSNPKYVLISENNVVLFSDRAILFCKIKE